MHNTTLHTTCKVTHILSIKQQKKCFFYHYLQTKDKYLINNKIIGANKEFAPIILINIVMLFEKKSIFKHKKILNIYYFFDFNKYFNLINKILIYIKPTYLFWYQGIRLQV